MKTGTIYQEGQTDNPKNIGWAVMILKLVANVLSWTGLFMVLISIFGLILVYIPLGIAEANYAFSKTELFKVVKIAEKQAAHDKNKKPGEANLPDTWLVPDENYSIYIPKIFAKSKVVANVDAGNAKEYLPALQKGVAEAKGLSHPGETGTTFLFAHSVGTSVDFARYNAVFYLLDKLTLGDGVEVMYKGKNYKYEVVDRQILAANDVQYLIPQKLSERLVLQTCYPPGTSWKRLVVVAKRI